MNASRGKQAKQQTENKRNTDLICSKANRSLWHPQGHMGVLSVNTAAPVGLLDMNETNLITMQGLARLGNWVA